MPYSPALVANAVIHRAKERGRSLDHMQVQKLVFFMHAWSLALKGQSMLSERPEAWPYGPVFTSLYHRLKGFGARKIDVLLEEYFPPTGQLTPLIPNYADAEFWSMVDQVLSRYGHFSALQLSELTHDTGGPWERTRQAQQVTIDDQLIREHFTKQLQHGNPASA
jgi:uncharacterized phage-associated protein